MLQVSYILWYVRFPCQYPVWLPQMIFFLQFYRHHASILFEMRTKESVKIVKRTCRKCKCGKWKVRNYNQVTRMAVVLGCIQHTAFEEFSLRHVGTEKNCTAKIELKKIHIVFLVERKKGSGSGATNISIWYFSVNGMKNWICTARCCVAATYITLQPVWVHSACIGWIEFIMPELCGVDLRKTNEKV